MSGEKEAMADSILIRLLPDLVGSDRSAGEAGAEGRWASVDEAEIRAILAAARVAPSADNAQTWRFVVVKSAETIRDLGQAVAEELRPVMASAPVVIVACGIKWLLTRARREQPFVMIDVPIALTHMVLQAQEIGLSYAWTLTLDEDRVREVLGIPPEVRVIGVLALGRKTKVES